MHWELWGCPGGRSGNMIGTWEREEEALAVVRDLLATDWTPDELSLGGEWGEDEEGDDADLPTVLTGEALVQRAESLLKPEHQSA